MIKGQKGKEMAETGIEAKAREEKATFLKVVQEDLGPNRVHLPVTGEVKKEMVSIS